MARRKRRNAPDRTPYSGPIRGFWSYVRADDRADRGRIRVLAEDVVAQYEMLTGEKIQLFFDQTSLVWGDDWKQKVDEFLESAAFFIAVITPRYLLSDECRREFRSFAQQAEETGLRGLILPLYYVDVPSLSDAAPNDDLLESVRRFQYMDWRERRFKEVETEEYRRAVDEVAKRLISENKQVDETRRMETPLAEDGDSSEKEPFGLIDRLARLEETMPKWKDTSESIAGCIEEVGQAMRDATNKITNRPAGPADFVYRKQVARQLAQQLEEPANRIFGHGHEFASQLHVVDDGIRTLIDGGTREAREGGEGEREALCEFFARVRTLASSVTESLEAVKGMVGILFNLQNLSRDLRPVLRRLSGGLTAMVDAREVTDEWVRLIESSGIECPE